jgi:hypothetical protein
LPVTTILILIVLAVVAIEAAAHKGQSRVGWIAFGVWAAAGFLSALATSSFALGLLVLPIALVAIVGASRVSVWPSALGFFAGIGVFGLLVASLNIGEGRSSDYYGWLALGIVLVGAAAAAFSRTRRVPRA